MYYSMCSEYIAQYAEIVQIDDDIMLLAVKGIVICID